ncbi:uncharacterized protein LOC143829701 [Paroedura picta]|uniref:uncharacterized protein LOC143829701 n=1 Tax=Paroedura picta TaxID=143630 RepID=UPI004056EC3B
MPVMMMVVWSLCQGCSNVPGPSCRDELTNTMHIIRRLKKSLKDLQSIFEDEGYGGIPSREPICILGNSDQFMDLSSIENKLCQYAQCLQHFVNHTRLPYRITRAFMVCQNFLGHLESTIKKMKLEPSALCTSSCTVPWSFAELTWEEIMKGPRLVQELLTYLNTIQFNCS